MGLIEGTAVGRRNWFYDEDGEAWDPPSIAVTLVAPDGSETHPVPVKEAVGIYLTTFELTADGRWIYQIRPSGGLNKIDQGYLLVGRSMV